ncbi:MAG TPA: hypothetical protein VJH34_02785 [archaeon]|nr:hypothetical protein [archaeon]
MAEFNASQVISKLFEELKTLGKPEGEFSNGSYRIESYWDPCRNHYCDYLFSGSVNKIGNREYVFTKGQNHGCSWYGSTKVDEAVMFAQLLKPENKKEAFIDTVRHSLERYQMIYSWQGDLIVLDAEEYVSRYVPKEMIAGRKISKTKIGNFVGIPVVFDEEKSPEDMKKESKDLIADIEPIGHQEVFYKDEVVNFLVDNVKKTLSIS